VLNVARKDMRLYRQLKNVCVCGGGGGSRGGVVVQGDYWC